MKKTTQKTTSAETEAVEISAEEQAHLDKMAMLTEFAAKVDGITYFGTLLPGDIEKEAKEKGLVLVYASLNNGNLADPILEINGDLQNGYDFHHNSNVYINKQGQIVEASNNTITTKLVFGKEKDIQDNEIEVVEGLAIDVTGVHNVKFTIKSGKKDFCQGAVFLKADLT